MSPDLLRTNGRFERRLAQPTIAWLDEESRFLPRAFLLEDLQVKIDEITAVRSEVRRDWRGRVERHLFSVRTNQGHFELQRVVSKDEWTIVGKLKE